MISVENLTKKFGEVTAVEKLTFQINDGEVFGFLGPNGAGKTTTVRMLCCLISRTSGKARIADYEIGNTADALKIRGMLGLVPDNVGLYNELTAFENLDFYGKVYEVPDARRKINIEHFLQMLGLWEKKDVLTGTFSKGMKQKLAIARALIHEPKILFMDEPTANLDPESAKTVRDFILELKKEDRTIFLNTHNLDEAQRLCDRIGILKTKLLTIGTPEQLKLNLRGARTEIKLAQVTDAIVNAVKKVALNRVEVSDNTLVIEVSNAEAENPAIFEAIVSAGGRIQQVNQIEPTLEEVYLNMVRK